MALQHADEQYTKWMHIENGNMMVRRLHRIEVQARDGRLYVLSGKDLPDGFVTCCGQGHKGKHIAQILLKPKVLGAYEAPEVLWPKGRDVLHVGIGFFGFMMVRFIIAILASI